MSIKTQTEQVAKLRRNVMELYISDHPLDCLTCSANGDCELQDMAGAVGLRDVRYGLEGKNHLESVIDDSNPYFSFDSSKCIVCSRCVRACDEIQGTMALTIEGRGFDSKVSASISESFLDSECVEPLEIQICSERSDHSAAKSLSITMRTPGNDHDLAT